MRYLSVILFLLAGCTLTGESGSDVNADILYCVGFCAFLDAQAGKTNELEAEEDADD